ncbi:unnamed protein product, partial [Ranitomeya imitator]
GRQITPALEPRQEDKKRTSSYEDRRRRTWTATPIGPGPPLALCFPALTVSTAAGKQSGDVTALLSGRCAHSQSREAQRRGQTAVVSYEEKHFFNWFHFKKAAGPRKDAVAQIQHWNIDKEQGRQTQVELNSKAANELTKTPEGGSPETAIPLVTTEVNSATEFTTIVCSCPPIDGYIGGLSTALQNAVDKPLMLSQIDFSIASLSSQEPASTIVQSEQKQTPKSASQSTQIKTPLGSSAAKPSQGIRTPNCDGSTPVRKEEESAFWKISMERSRVEGSPSEFQSLTPSQIKSLEKGEKPLPVFCRQDSFPKEKEVIKPEKPEKSLVSEKPSVVTKQPKTTNPSSVSLALETPRQSQSSVSTLDDVFLPEPPARMPPVTEISKEPENEASSSGPQLFSQINTSSVLLKSGFDFLDNW